MLTMGMGKLITLEGTEGAGKSTAMQFIQSYLQSHAISALLTREPGGTALAEKIRQLLLEPKSAEKLTAETELLLMFAARAQHIQSCILPALKAGQWVVSDRYIDASYAYQGGGRKMSLDRIQWLDEWLVADCYPSLTLLLNVPFNVGLSRAEKRNTEKDRIEAEAADFFERVQQAYLARSAADPKRIKMVDASLPPEKVQAQIRAILDTFLERLT